MIILTSDYLTGIESVDREHEELVQLINDLDTALTEQKDDIQTVAKSILHQLRNYASTHFKNEEDYMEKIHDPELKKQQKEHADFLQKINEIPLDGSFSAEDLNKILNFLIRWLFHHILHSDRMIGKSVQSSVQPDNAAESALPDEDIDLTDYPVHIDTEEGPFCFTAKYLTGIPSIDAEHRRLFEITREANDLIHADHLYDKYDKILHILSELTDYTNRHFQHEEEYMLKAGYPGYELQKQEHAAFIEKLTGQNLDELDFIDENQQEYLIELIQFLLNWLTGHILKSDCSIGRWERSQKKEKDSN